MHHWAFLADLQTIGIRGEEKRFDYQPSMAKDERILPGVEQLLCKRNYQKLFITI